MDERRFLRMVLCFVAVAVCLWSSRAYSQEAVGEPNAAVEPNVPGEAGRTGIGKENPFAGVPEEIKSDTKEQTNYAVSAKGSKPDLFVETVFLKGLNAQSLKSAIANMSSEYGSVSADVKNNSLIVCDTKENLQKILTQIHRAELEGAAANRSPEE
jgi:hypothetical protein